MLRIAGVTAILLATGCLVESGGVDPNDNGSMLGRICTTDIAVTGSFVQSKAAPPNEDGTPYTGCWPIGTWTFSATYGMGDCSDKPALLPQYQFKVDEMLDADGIPYQVPAYMTDPSVHNRVKVSQGGDGLCEGELNLFSADGKQVTILKPELYIDNHLGGSGELQVYGKDQWLGDAN